MCAWHIYIIHTQHLMCNSTRRPTETTGQTAAVNKYTLDMDGDCVTRVNKSPKSAAVAEALMSSIVDKPILLYT